MNVEASGPGAAPRYICIVLRLGNTIINRVLGIRAFVVGVACRCTCLVLRLGNTIVDNVLDIGFVAGAASRCIRIVLSLGETVIRRVLDIRAFVVGTLIGLVLFPESVSKCSLMAADLNCLYRAYLVFTFICPLCSSLAFLNLSISSAEAFLFSLSSSLSHSPSSSISWIRFSSGSMTVSAEAACRLYSTTYSSTTTLTRFSGPDQFGWSGTCMPGETWR